MTESADSEARAAGTELTEIEQRRLAVLEDARRRGIEYWATGNEPGWTLEIGPGRVVWSTDYGQTVHEFAASSAAADEDAAALAYEARGEGGVLKIRLRDGGCADDMSGERFDLGVTLSFEGRDYRGCGVGLSSRESRR